LTVSDLSEFVARWTLLGALAFLLAWTLGYLSGLASKWWRMAAVVVLGLFSITTLAAALSNLTAG